MSRGIVLVVLSLVLPLSNAAEAAVHVQSVAVSGKPAPGVPNSTFYEFSNPTIGDKGHIAFCGLTQSSSSSLTSEGVWMGMPGAVKLLARQGAAAPGGGGGSFRSFGGLAVVNAAGRAGFGCLVTPNTSPGRAYVGVPDNLIQVGASSVSFSGTGAPALNDSGLAASIQTHNNSQDNFVWTGTSSSNWSPLPTVRGEGVQLNDAGTIASAKPVYDATLWYGPASAPSIVMRAGDPLPGSPSGTGLQSIVGLLLNNAGDVALTARYSGMASGDGVWLGRPGALRLVFLGGSQLALGGTTYFVHNPEVMAFNDRGQALVSVSLSSAGQPVSALLLTDGVSTRLVARRGQTAPGTNLLFDAQFYTALNNRGDVVVRTSVRPSQFADAQTGLWHAPASGGLSLLLLTGQKLDVDPAGAVDQRTIRTLDMAAGAARGSGHPHPFTDDGRLAFRANFTDGSSGIFVLHKPVIPLNHKAPGRIQAENYLGNGPGASYADTTPDNGLGAYRPDDGVDIGATADGAAYYVGQTAAGEWLQYRLNVAEAGVYEVRIRYAAATAGRLRLRLDGQTIASPVLPATPNGGWGVRAVRVNLPAGPHRLRLVVVEGGFNLDYLHLIAAQ